MVRIIATKISGSLIQIRLHGCNRGPEAYRLHQGVSRARCWECKDKETSLYRANRESRYTNSGMYIDQVPYANVQNARDCTTCFTLLLSTAPPVPARVASKPTRKEKIDGLIVTKPQTSPYTWVSLFDLPPTAVRRYGHVMVLLPDGRILLSGGATVDDKCVPVYHKDLRQLDTETMLWSKAKTAGGTVRMKNLCRERIDCIACAQ